MKILFAICLLAAFVFAQEKTKEEKPTQKATVHELSREEVETLRSLEGQMAIAKAAFDSINADLKRVLTDKEKIALVDKLQLARWQSDDLNGRGEAFVNDLKKKYKCARCQIIGEKFVEQLEGAK